MGRDINTSNSLIDPLPPALSVAESLEAAQQRDPLGHKIQIVLAMGFLFLLPVATAPKDIALGLMLLWGAIRLPHTWRCYKALLTSPAAGVLIAWVGWQSASLGWSSDPKQGLDELGTTRMLLVPLALWPVLNAIPLLIVSLLGGLLVQNGAQLLQATDLFNVRPHEGRGRSGGLINPIQTGAFCVAAICWHLSGALHGRAAWRVFSIAMLLVSATALAMTKSRGPWIAAAVVVPAMLIVLSIRRPSARRVTSIIVVSALVLACAAWPLVGTSLVNRIKVGAREAERAIEDGIYGNSVGSRIGMLRWSIDIFLENPICGAGAGSYPEAQAAHPDYQAALARTTDRADRTYIMHEHPHSLYLYTLACNGLIGAAILLVAIIVLIRQAWLDPFDHMYADGTFFALLGWLIGAHFDSYNLDGHRLGLLAFIVAITMRHRSSIDPRYASMLKCDSDRSADSSGGLSRP